MLLSLVPITRRLPARPLSRQYSSNPIQYLKQTQPCFSVDPGRVNVLKEPKEFYALLLDMIRRAERRIMLSSLYIGSDEKELVEALNSALLKNPKLNVHLTLDLNRSTRLEGERKSTAHLLLPLLRAYPDRTRVTLFRSPSLRGPSAKLVPQRFNEGFGTWHAKIYCVDDEVMISGANLNSSYFTNRQDRYLHFTNASPLANFCSSFLNAAESFSYRLLPHSPEISNRYSRHQHGYTLEWPDEKVHPHHIKAKANRALNKVLDSWRESHMFGEKTPSGPQIYPLIQAGQFGIREEESFLQRLLSYTPESAQERPLFNLTTGYFNLHRPYQQFLLANQGSDFRVLVSSPKANGFYGSKGLSGRIPEGYTHLERIFMRAVQGMQRVWTPSQAPGIDAPGKGVQLCEWERKGWTYHAKGIWYSPSASTLPTMTLFGSTNLAARSAERDVELGFVLVLPEKESECNALRQSLADEVQNLRKYGQEWKGAEGIKDERKVRFGTKLLAWLVGGML